MARATIQAGICGFSTQVEASSEDGRMVHLDIQSECPHIQQAAPDLIELDAFEELFKKPHETKAYERLFHHVPHPMCPVYAGLLKATEVAIGTALPNDASIHIEA